MICLFFEGEQYIETLEISLGERFIVSLIKTPYGEQRVLINPHRNLMCITNAGHIKGISNRDIPKSVAYILKEHKVDGMLMVSKVGGINPLLRVGDIVLMDDYIDMTTIYDKSYYAFINPNIPRYDMQQPFCTRWGQGIFSLLKGSNISGKRNIFERGTYICTDGPGFESSAEIQAYRLAGADVVGHYLSPYVYYTRELKISFAAVSIVSNSYSNPDEILLDNDEIKTLINNIIDYALSSFRREFKEYHKLHWIKNLE